MSKSNVSEESAVMWAGAEMSIEDRLPDCIARLRAEIAELEAQVLDQRQVLKTQVDAWGNQVKQLTDNNNKLKERIAELEAESAEQRVAIKIAIIEHQNTVTQLQAKIAELKAESARLRAENRYLNNTGAGLLRS